MYYKGRNDEYGHHFGKIKPNNPEKEANIYYKNLHKIIKKYNKYISGKGKPLNQEEMKIFVEYLKRSSMKSKDENEENLFKVLIIQLENEIYLENLKNSNSDSDNDEETLYGNLYEDIDYSFYNTSVSNESEYNANKKFPEKIYKYCENLTDKTFEYDPAIGREKELEELMITVLTPNKSAVLIGQPGVGKTAIIEGLAYRIQKGFVPETLKGYTIFQTSATVLNSNCSFNGMLEKRVLDLFNILSKGEKIILFIDEIHTLIGTGSGIGKTLDIANIIKPFLTSNDICLVGATTIDEYDSFFGTDMAFQRRFQTINVSEPDDNALHSILVHTIEKYSKMYNITADKKLTYYIAKLLVKNTKATKRNYEDFLYNPDVSITIIASAFGYARLYNKKELSIEDIAKAYNNSQRVVGELEFDKLYYNKLEHINKVNNKVIKVNFN